MDSLTHALVASAIFALIGHPELVPFVALGAVVPDIDVLFHRFSDRDPRLYIFVHGGFTHSIIGALITAALAALIALPVATVAGYPATLPVALLASAAGALSHVGLDWLAYPGIPLLFPATDRKYTLGIAAGPTPYLLIASLVYGAFLWAGKASISDPGIYLGLITLLIAAGIALKLFVRGKASGRAVPGFNPLRWLIIAETPSAYEVYGYHLLRGRSPGASYEKRHGVSAEEVRSLESSPEVRRLRYNSYVVTVAKDGGTIVFADPLRAHGHIWYPPYYQRLSVPV